MSRRSQGLVVAVLMAFLAMPVLANVWNGSLNEEWFDPNNWDGGLIPGIADRADIEDALYVNAPVISDPCAVCGTVRIPVADYVGGLLTIDGGQLDVGGEVLTARTTDSTGAAVVQNGGILNIGTNGKIGHKGAGSLTVTDSTVRVGKNFRVGNIADSGAAGTVTLNGAALLEMLGTSADYTYLGAGANTSGTVVINNGVFDAGDTQFHVGFLGQGAVTVNNGSLLVNNNDLIVNDGVLEINGGMVQVGNNVPEDNFFTLEINSPGIVRLYGGELYLNDDPRIAEGGSLDIRNAAQLRMARDQEDEINDLIGAALLTAWGGRGELQVVVDEINNETVVTPGPFDPLQAWGGKPRGDVPGSWIYDPNMSWRAGDNAVQHVVFLGTDEAAIAAVAPADAASPYYQTTYALGNEIHSATGTLQLGVTYYWRVDEVNADTSVTVGTVWSFTVANYITIDDADTETNHTGWTADGGGAVAVVNEADEDDPGTEWPEQVALGDNSVALTYDNTASPFVSTASAEFSPVRNWTAEGICSLLIRFHGDEVASPTGPLFVTLTDSGNQSATVNYPTTSDLFEYSWDEDWRQWHIALSGFAGIDLTAVKRIAVGVGDGVSAGTAGVVYLDDIRRYVPACFPELWPGDLDNGDCRSDLNEMQLVSAAWGETPTPVTAAAPAAGPRVYYDFNEGSGLTLGDQSGNGFNASIIGAPVWDAAGGPDGSACLDFNTLFYAVVDDAVNAFASLDQDATVSVWVNGDAALQPYGGQVCLGWDDPSAKRQLLKLTVPFLDGAVIWMAGQNIGDNYLRYFAKDPADFAGVWNHYAFVKRVQGVQDYRAIYLNGVRVAEMIAPVDSMSGIGEFGIAGQPNGGGRLYAGKMDELRVYDTALTQAEIVSLAGQASVLQPSLAPADTDGDGDVDFDDLADVLAIWLTDTLWP